MLHFTFSSNSPQTVNIFFLNMFVESSSQNKSSYFIIKIIFWLFICSFVIFIKITNNVCWDFSYYFSC